MGLKIIFFGTPPFSARILDFLLKKGVDVACVVSRPDKPKGRSRKLQPTAVKEYLEKEHPDIPLYQPKRASSEEFEKTLKSYQPDLFIVVAYGQIIRQNLLDIPKIMPINVHTSLLPKFRGAAPIQRALLAGEKESGVTIMEMVLELDAGDMLHVEKTPIDEEMIFAELEEKILELSCVALEKTLEKIAKGTLQKTPQDPSGVTFADKIAATDCAIDWRRPARDIHNQIRALSPQPGAFAHIEGGKRFKIKRSRLAPEKATEPGAILVFDKKRFVVACGDGALELLEVQPEGKKPMLARAFMCGAQAPIFTHSLF